MTFCLALAVPGISLVVADTRVSLTHDGSARTIHDGPTDFNVTVQDRGYSITLPFRFRKLRQVAPGWATAAGDYVMSDVLLKLLATRGQRDIEETRGLLRVAFPMVKSQIQAAAGFSDQQLDQTMIAGAPFIEDPYVWLVSFSDAIGNTCAGQASHCANWPLDVPAEVKQLATQRFEEAVVAANSNRSVPAVVKAAAELVHAAAEISHSVGKYTQVGITVGAPRGLNASYYIQAESASILGATDLELSEYIERVG